MEGQLLRGVAAQQICSIREKIDLEIRIREGIWRLLSLSTKKDQVLHAVKNLMVCSARIQAYTAELQKTEEEIAKQTRRRDSSFESKERESCRGKIALSDIRIPLMWKDSDHFGNKECTQRFAIFCLFKMGAQVFDTDMMIVDQTITDICFENVTIFNEARPDFQIKIEVYSCSADESPVTNTPRKLAKKLKTSISKATGKKTSKVLQEENPDTSLLSVSSVATTPLIMLYHKSLSEDSIIQWIAFYPVLSCEDQHFRGAKYHLLAHTTLTLENAGDCFKTHNLSVHGDEECSFWIPLYGNVCCRLVAQPACMAEDALAGFLNEQQTGKGLVVWRKLYCALRGGKLRCFYGPEEIEAQVEPALVVPIDKETRIQAMEKDSKKMHCFSVLNMAAGQAVSHIFAADSLADFQEWMDTFRQHFFDLSQWKHCCEELMRIEIMSPRKPPLFLAKEATSVYHDMSIDSPVKLESVTDIIQKKIGETNGQFLIGRDDESTAPPWAAVFDGNHEMVIEKKVLSPTGKLAPEGKRKKRRAPLPPPDQPPFSIKTQGSTGPSKDSGAQASVSGASLLDPRLSPPMHSLQKPAAAPRKLLPARKNSLADGGHTDAKTSVEAKPVPAPRQKSIRDILDPRSWLQAQV